MDASGSRGGGGGGGHLLCNRLATCGNFLP